LPPPEDEGLPPAKRRRLQAPTSLSTQADVITTDSPDDTPTYSVTPAASLPSAATSRAPRRSWTPEEDAKLTEEVKKHSKGCWVAVAAMVPGRTRVQCLSRWTHTLDPADWQKAGQWTPEEDSNQIEVVKKHGNHWVAVAPMVRSRTSEQCRSRWTHILDPANGNKHEPRRLWKLEDVKLTDAVKKHGKNWVAIAAIVPGRTNVQCRQRWTKTLDPANEKGKWTPEEDAKLTEAVRKHGNHCDSSRSNE
jgi:hypothetical protein